MFPGQHIVIVQRGVEGSFRGWELRDTLLILLPGPTVLFAVLYRVPLSEPTMAAQVSKTGTGAINIGACRVRTNDKYNRAPAVSGFHGIGGYVKGSGRQSDSSDQGRWPSNLLLVHHAECVQRGVRQVNEPEAKQMSRQIYGKTNTLGRTLTFAGDDGLETIPAWECHATCPVRLLDEQSGDLAPRGNINPTNRLMTTGFTRGGSGEPGLVNYKDTGGASRFYPQFRSLAEALDWLTTLVCAVKG